MKHFSSLLIIILFTTFSVFSQNYTAGSKVEIKWGNTWYAGAIKEVKGDEYKIGYDGYSSTWDEWVKKDRLRTPGKAEAGTTTSTTTSTTASTNNANNNRATTPANVNAASYKDTNGKLYFRTFMWMGMYGSSLDISWIYLGNGGSIVRNPKHGVNPVDFKAELTNNANNTGKYKINGNKLFITWSNGKTEEWSLETKNGDYTAINGGIVTRPAPLPANYKLNGQYAGGAVLPNVSSIRTFVFNRDGTFSLNRSGAVHTADVTGLSQDTNKGTYTITGNTLRLNFDNGQKQVANILVWDTGGGKKHLVINGTSFPQEG